MLLGELNPVPVETPRCAAHSWALARSWGFRVPASWLPMLPLACEARAA